MSGEKKTILCRWESEHQTQAAKIFANIALNISRERKKLSCRFIGCDAISLSAVSAFSAPTHTIMYKTAQLTETSCSARYFLFNERSLVRFAFHRRKFNFLLKELCQIAFGAVSTCFIYSSALKVLLVQFFCVLRTTGSCQGTQNTFLLSWQPSSRWHFQLDFVRES